MPFDRVAWAPYVLYRPVVLVQLTDVARFICFATKKGMHQDTVPRVDVSYGKQTVLDMMAAAEHGYLTMDPEPPLCVKESLVYMKETMQKLLAAAERKAEERSATRYLCARPRPPPPFIPIPPPHFDLHETDIAAHRHSPYMVTGLTTSIA